MEREVPVGHHRKIGIPLPNKKLDAEFEKEINKGAEANVEVSNVDAEEYGSGQPRMQTYSVYSTHMGRVFLAYSHIFHTPCLV